MGGKFRISKRAHLPFRCVNMRGAPGYDPSLQRHHLLPVQLLSRRCFGALFDTIGRDTVGFEDFRRNGMLLPAKEEAVWRTLLPLHRGPHHDYNCMVMTRVGVIEEGWSTTRLRNEDRAAFEAIEALGRLQNALRRRLLDQARPIMLNRRDPAVCDPDFGELDAMAETLWSAAA